MRQVFESLVSKSPVVDQSPRWAPNARNARIIAALILVAGAGIGLAMYVSFSNSAHDQDGRWMGIAFVVLAPWVAASSWLTRVRRLDVGLDDVVVVPPEEIAVATRTRADAGGRAPEANGLGFRYGSALAWMFVGAQVVSVGFFLALVALLWPRGTQEVEAFALGVFVFGALVLVLPAIEILRGGLARGVVILTPEQVIHRSWMFDSWCSWDEVLGVEPVWLFADRDVRVRVRRESGAPKRMHRRAWVLAQQPEARHAPDLLINAAYISVHPDLLLGTLRFYAENPDRRSELGTQVAVDRVCRVVQAPQNR